MKVGGQLLALEKGSVGGGGANPLSNVFLVLEGLTKIKSRQS